MAILKVKDADGNIIPIPAIQGKSAYQYAKEGGYKGTEEEFAQLLSGLDSEIEIHNQDELAHPDIREEISQLSEEIEDIKDGMGGNYTNLLTTAVSTKDMSQVLTGTDGSVGYLNNTRVNSSGNYVDADVDTSGLMRGVPGDTVRLKNVSLYIDASCVHGGITFYKSDGTWISGANIMSELHSSFNAVKDLSGNIIQFTIPSWEDDSAMFAIACQDINETSVITVNEEIIDTDDARFTALENSLSELNKRMTAIETANPEDATIPDYWLSALEEGAEAINSALCTAGRNKSAFLFYSDVHWNYGSQISPILLKYLYNHTGMTKTNFGGDIVNDEATDYDTMEYLWEWRNMLKDLPNHHSVVGNHDDGNPNTIFDEKYVYGYLFAPEETPDIVMGDGMYYYIDNPSEKTRYLYLDTAFKGVDDNQKAFIKQALIDTPSGWHIVVISHIWYQPDYTQGDIRPMPITGLDSGASQILTMLDNYNLRSGDYAECEGKVEFCIGGHVHQDYVNTTTSGIPIILVETDSKHVRSALSYTAGTTTEASVNGIIADYNTNKINVIRVGRGSSFIVDIATGGTETPDEPETPDVPKPTYTNLFVAEEATNGFRLNSSGILTQSDTDLTTGFIKVQPNTSYIIRVKNRLSGGSVSIGRLSEYSTANESSHKIQYRCTETDDYSYEDNYAIFVFPFTTSDITEFIRLNITQGANHDFIITLNEPIV